MGKQFDGLDNTGFQGSTLVLNGNSRKALNDNERKLYTKNRTFKYPGYFILFRCTGKEDAILTLVGLTLAAVSGIFLPIGNLAYSDVVNIMLERQHPRGTNGSSPQLSLYNWIGGGPSLPQNASSEERFAALQEDVAAGNGLLLWSCFIQFVMSAAAVMLVKMSAARQAGRIRQKLFTAVMRHDMTWFDVKGGQNLAAKFNEEVAHIENGVGSTLAILMFFLMNVVFGLVVSAVLSWRLTLVVGTLVPLNMILFLVITRFQNNIASKEVALSANAGNVFGEAISKIRTVLSFDGAHTEVKKYDFLLSETSRIALRRGVFLGLGVAVTWIFNYLTSIFAFVYGSQLLQDSDTAKLYIISMITASVWVTTVRFGASYSLLEKLITAVNAALSVFRTIDAPHGIDPMDPDGVVLFSVAGRLDFQNIHFRYPARPEVTVLNGVSFSVRAGENVAIVGSSGSGKSTILQLLQRFYDPNEGSLAVDGLNLKKLNVAKFREHIGVVGQEASLFAGTIADNIRFGLMTATEQEIISAARSANAHEFIMRLHQGYDTVIGSKGATLSGGEKQRIAIARALVRNPTIMLLDEPTSALDAESRDIVQNTLQKVCKGKTTLVVTHRLASTKSADRIIVIDCGRLVEEGTHDELMARNGIYSQMSLCEGKMERWHEETENEIKATQSIVSETCEAASKPMEAEIRKADQPSDESAPFNIMLAWNKPELWFLIGGFLASAVSGALLPIGAVIYGEFVGSFTLSSMENVRQRVALFTYVEVGILVTMALSSFLVVFLFTVSRERLTNRLKLQAFSSILAQELGWFDEVKNHVGALYSRVSRDVTLIHDFSGPAVGIIIQASFNLLTGFTISMYYSWKLTLVVEAVIPFLFLGPVIDGYMTKKEDSLEMAHLESASAIYTECVANKQVVTSLGLEHVMIARYNQALQGSDWHSKMAAVSRGVAFGLAQALPGVAFAVTFAYGAVLMRDEELAFENIVKISEVLLIGAWTVASDLVFTASYSTAQQAAGRLLQLFNRTSAIKSGFRTDLPPQHPSNSTIQYSNISMSYPTRPNTCILRDVDLGIKEGENVAVIGPSGSGKSSVLHLLQRLYVPQTGHVSLHGVDITDLTLGTLRHHLGLVSQEPTLFSGTIKENIAYGDNSREIPIDEIIAAARKANIHEFISQLPAGYDTALGKSAQLSGGQKQRIAIARALVRDPAVLLLDEATSALDPESERLVQEALNLAAKGRTTITIAHRMGAVAHTDRILRLEGGRFVDEKVQARL